MINTSVVSNNSQPSPHTLAQNTGSCSSDTLQYYSTQYGSKVSDTRMSDCKVTDNKVSDRRMSDTRMSDCKVSDSKMAHSKVSGNKVSGNKVSGNKMAGNKKYGNILSPPPFQADISLAVLVFLPDRCTDSPCIPGDIPLQQTDRHMNTCRSSCTTACIS